MNNQEAEQLIRKFLNGQCTEAEQLLLRDWYQQLEESQPVPPVQDDSQMKRAVLETVLAQKRPVLKVNRNWYRIAVAASVLFALGLVLYMTGGYGERPAVFFTTDISPGKANATLTLSDGSVVDLGEAKTGSLNGETAVKLSKGAKDLLVYEHSDAKKTTEVPLYNTIRTPAGGKFSAVLPDGTHIWLNASSSIRFPVHFQEKERRIDMTGEAYFEVSKNKDQPFLVYSGDQVVRVLGTHFNINAYADEAFSTTTLEEGKITVHRGNSSVVVNPGQQVLNKITGPLLVKTADVQRELAWKDELFDFKSADIRFIMRQLSRWYNVEVSYQGEISNDLFTGKINKNIKLSEALKILSNQNIHFKIEGKKIIVIS